MTGLATFASGDDGLGLSREARIVLALAEPAHVADVRPAALDRLKPLKEFDDGLVRRALAEMGAPLGAVAEHRGLESYAEDRRAVVALTNFSPPSEASAEIVVAAHRFGFTRSALQEIALWATLDLGVREVRARIASDNRRAANLARRFGFRFLGPATLDDGRAAGLWRFTADDFFTSRLVWGRSASPKDRKAS